MNIKASVYEDDGDGFLHQLGSGTCIAYCPVAHKNNKLDPYVSLNFGKYRIHLNKDDFTKFCQQFLKNSLYDTKRLK